MNGDRAASAVLDRFLDSQLAFYAIRLKRMVFRRLSLYAAYAREESQWLQKAKKGTKQLCNAFKSLLDANLADADKERRAGHVDKAKEALTAASALTDLNKWRV